MKKFIIKQTHLLCTHVQLVGFLLFLGACSHPLTIKAESPLTNSVEITQPEIGNTNQQQGVTNTLVDNNIIFVNETNTMASANAEIINARTNYLDSLLTTLSLSEDKETLQGEMRTVLEEIYYRTLEGLAPKALFDYYDRIEALYPDVYFVKDSLAIITTNAFESIDEAILALSNRLSSTEYPGRYYYYQGLLQVAQTNLNDATKSFRMAATLPPFESAPYWKYLQLADTNQLNETKQFIQAGIDKVQYPDRLLELLANLEVESGHYDKALSHLLTIASNKVEQGESLHLFPSFNYKILLCAVKTNQLEHAANALLNVIPHEPDLITQFSELAYNGEISFEKAIDVLERALPQATEEPRIPYHLGYLCRQTKEYERSARYFRQAEEALLLKDGTEFDLAKWLSPVFYFHFGSSLERAGDYINAEKKFRLCIHKYPDFADAYNYLAYMFAEQSTKLDQAHTLVDKALSMDVNAAYLDTKGWIYFKQGAYEEALEWLLRADKLLPGDPEISLHLSDAYEKLNQPKEALVYLRVLEKQIAEHPEIIDPEDLQVKISRLEALLESPKPSE